MNTSTADQQLLRILSGSVVDTIADVITTLEAMGAALPNQP
jgi:hypothetical protein